MPFSGAPMQATTELELDDSAADQVEVGTSVSIQCMSHECDDNRLTGERLS
jgi:hypothetical protein